jgi:hypothetical protein
LVDRPDAVRRFQTRVALLRVLLGVALTAATVLAIWFNRG